jgi:sarcosine oxidase, subunit alpha
MLELDRRPVEIYAGDTIASAAYRAGVRVFSRSFKFHRPRGLYCCTGDCPNCLVTVDGDPGVLACVTPAKQGMNVRRPGGVPSADHDALGILWTLRAALPVGFYYKTLIRPRSAWRFAEPVVRRMTGLDIVPPPDGAARSQVERIHPEVLIVGGGVAGLSAARRAAEIGDSVLVCEQHGFGDLQPLPEDRRAVSELVDRLRRMPGVRLLEHSKVIAIYDGPVAAVSHPGGVAAVHPGRIIIATGAVERHLVAPASDRPGVWLSRGAASFTLRHGLPPGGKTVVVSAAAGRSSVAGVLAGAGVEIVETIHGEERLESVIGRSGVRAVRVLANGRPQTIDCDSVVAELGVVPRDHLLRMLDDERISGAGEVTQPGLTTDDARQSGEDAVRASSGQRAADSLSVGPRRDGILCLCEDVRVADVKRAYSEGFRSTEILKRYTTATMGPCQGAMCQQRLRETIYALGGNARATATTTARPPAGLRMADAACFDHHHEQRTALHDRHVAMGARMELAGRWIRPWSYGDEQAEYLAVRKAVGVMDVSTLGKVRVAGPDAVAFLEAVYPLHVSSIEPTRYRYALLLNEAGYVFDDGLVCRVSERDFFLTFTSSGAGGAVVWLHQWATRWRMNVRIVDVTSALGAIVVAGPRSRELLQLLADPADVDAVGHMQHAEVAIAGVPCRVIRVGFLGELGYELHHERWHGVGLWDRLLAAGDPLGIRPHGLAAQDLLRLEKGHMIMGQDTDFDTTADKLGMGNLIARDKPFFIGKGNHDRLAQTPAKRRLIGLDCGEDLTPSEGDLVSREGVRIGYVTSAGWSPSLGRGIALAWVATPEGTVPDRVLVGSRRVMVVRPPFYDPEGRRVRS